MIPVRTVRAVAGIHGSVEVAGISDQGPVRKENQDAWEAFPIAGGSAVGLVLADGMGGHAGGLESAEAAVAAASRVLRETTDAERAIGAAVEAANAAVAGVREQLGGNPGTTLVVAVVEHGSAVVANIGDSRAYRIRGGAAMPITEDHSWVGEQVKAGTLSAPEARHHMRRNIITRAVMGDPVVADEFPVHLQMHDVLLLCSDGMWEPLDDAVIGDFFSSDASLEQILTWSCDAALGAGGTDNVTAVAARWLGEMEAR